MTLLTGKIIDTNTSFNGYFLVEPGLADCPLDSRSLLILILSNLTRQAETLHTHMTHCAVTLTFIGM